MEEKNSLRVDGYRSTELQDVLQIRRLFTIHYFEYTKDFSFPGEAHDFWELCYVDNGVVEVQAGERECLLFKGDAIIHPPREFHSIQADGRTAPNLVVLSFACDSPLMNRFADRVLHIDARHRECLGRILWEARGVFHEPFDDPLTDGLDRLDSPSFAGEQMIRLQLELLLLEILREEEAPNTQEPHPTSSKGGAERTFNAAVHLLLENMDRTLSVDEICSTVGCCRSRLHDVFKAKTGRGPGEYAKRLKLERAKQMIREGNRNFSEIATALDYSSIQHFSKVFKRYEGMTPSAYSSSVKLRSQAPPESFYNLK